MDARRREGRKALIAYLTAGYPGFKEQTGLVEALAEGGVDVLEIGVPFSDPVADGPTIQFSSQESLKRGTSLRSALKWAADLGRRVSIPTVIMSYMNPILHYGVDAFARDAAKAGVSGVIVPDLIPEEAEPLRRALDRLGIRMIFLVAPTSPPARERRIAKATGGFLYAVSVTGVTGARRRFEPQTKAWLRSLRRLTRRPVCVGFGISGPEQIRELRPFVDGFIVGSALIDLIRRTPSAKRRAAVREFARKLAKECSHAG